LRSLGIPKRFQPVALFVENIHFFGFVLSIPWLDNHNL
jgi:hypothetical protein